MKYKTTPERAKALHKTRAYYRYRKYLQKLKPKTKAQATKLLMGAFQLVEDFSGHKYHRNAIVASEVCTLLVEEFPSCIEEERW